MRFYSCSRLLDRQIQLFRPADWDLSTDTTGHISDRLPSDMLLWPFFVTAGMDDGLRVSPRALAILFPDPDDPKAKQTALLEAAQAPALFEAIFGRWERRPTKESLEAFLVKRGFNTNSFDDVTQAFYETFDLVTGLRESYDSANDKLDHDNADERGEEIMERPREQQAASANSTQPIAGRPGINSTKPIFDFEAVEISTRIDNQEDLEELLSRLQQIKSMLPKKGH